MIGKRGFGHIEMIISFVLFIGFLLFGLYFFNPVNNNRVLDSSVEYAYDEIVKNSTTSMIRYSVIIDQSINSQIVSIPLSREEAEGIGIRVENEIGNVKRYAEGIGLIVEKGNDNFLNVGFGDFLSSKTNGLNNPMPLTLGENFFISSSDTKKIVTEIRLEKLSESYYSDYLDLKQRFNLPNRIDFAFVVDMGDKKIEALRDVPEGVEAFSKSKRVEILRRDGKVNYADLIVSVW